MMLYMLDTNAVSHFVRMQPAVVGRVVTTPMASLCISSITEGELLFGLDKRPEAKQLHLAVREFLRRVDVLDWDSSAAEHYGKLRADLQSQDKLLAPLDMLIAAHAASVGAVLVSNDHAFRQVSTLQIEDWTVG